MAKPNNREDGRKLGLLESSHYFSEELPRGVTLVSLTSFESNNDMNNATSSLLIINNNTLAP